MVKSVYYLIFILLFSFIWVYPISAEMYQWTDKNGVLRFSDTPPPNDVKSLETLETYDTTDKQEPAKTSGIQKSIEQSSMESQEPLKIVTTDILGKWKHLGISNSLSAKKLQKPYKPQNWEFKSDGTVIYRIGDKSNSCPFHINGNEIVTLPFPKMYPKDTKSFIVKKISRNAMVWKDPNWDSFIHVKREY